MSGKYGMKSLPVHSKPQAGGGSLPLLTLEEAAATAPGAACAAPTTVTHSQPRLRLGHLLAVGPHLHVYGEALPPPGHFVLLHSPSAHCTFPIT